MSKTSNRLRLALLCAVSAAASRASAGGFAASEISVEGLGRANAGEAAATGAAPLWWNPASVAGAPEQVSIGIHYRDISSTLTDAGSTITRPIPPAGLTTPVGGLAGVRNGVPDTTIPTLALAAPIGGGLTLGVAVTHPFHLKTVLPAGAWTRYDTLRSRIDVTSVQVGAAAHATPWLDVGAGVEAQTMSALLDSASPNLNPAAADGVQRLSGTGWNFGWTVGAQAHTDTLRVGLSYRSSVRHRLHGQISLSGLQAPLDGANFTAPAETVFSTPWTASLAARWQVSPALTLDGQVVRTGWSKYDTITVNFAGTTAAIPQSYKDTTSVALGADYAVAAGWTVRGGVQYDPTPTHDFLREPGVPDGDRWIYAL
ncbi:MAG: long-chain fatty acid transport protein, partial [Phenylobacterium sp.]|nr:long-chain fatty acid transport protein [Phenylobacterium sp.]